MVDIQMPQLGETVTEGTITRWFKQVGDQVAEDEPLFEVSTDKVDSEVPSPVSGTLSEIVRRARRSRSAPCSPGWADALPPAGVPPPRRRPPRRLRPSSRRPRPPRPTGPAPRPPRRPSSRRR